MEAHEVIGNAALAWSPPPALTASEWADQFRYVAVGPFPGKWSTDRTPYLREILDCVTDPAIEQIVLMKPTRIGGTEVVNNAIGYYVHYDPCQILYVQTSLEEGRKYSNEILQPMIEATPVLREKVARPRGRKATQTKLHKTFAGGSLAIVGAKSPKGFRMVSKRVVILDDMDGYEDNKEGDPVKLAEGRAKDYWNKKIIKVSNPTTEGVSRIHEAFLASDQRYRYVPCPHCSEFQVLKFGGKDEDYGLKWEKDSEDIWYLCECCHKRIFEYHKVEMDRRGEWRATAESPGVAGFHLNPFLCAWHPWKDFRKEFESSKNDPRKLMVFLNQWLGKVWKEDPGERVDEETLYNRRETYAAEVPTQALILTLAVDVQDKYIECEVKGWGEGEESWGIEHKIINGSFLEEKVQVTLDELRRKTYRHESGLMMPVKITVIDSGGHFTTQVYSYVKDREGENVYAVKGSTKEAADVLDGPIKTNNSRKAKFQMVGVGACKDILYGRLNLKKEGPGYFHFPMSYDQEYFRQLMSEKPVTTKSGRREWKVLPGRRNEAVDLHNYGLAALRIYNPDWDLLRIQGADDISRLVYRNHNARAHYDSDIEVKPGLPLILCCTFGRNPLVWMLCQSDGKNVWAVDEIAIRNADTAQMAVEVLKRYGNHGAGFIVYGSAAGTVRSSTGKSEYAILRDYGFSRQVVKSTNPLPTDCINAINNMLEDIAGKVRLTYSSRCVMLKKDFERCMKGENGEMESTEFGRGIAAEALGYYINKEFPLKAARPNPNRRFWK